MMVVDLTLIVDAIAILQNIEGMRCYSLCGRREMILSLRVFTEM